MPIALICGACEAKLTAPDAAAGKKVKCRQCGVVLEIPRPEPESEPDFEVVEDAPTMMLPAAKLPAPKPASAKAPPPAAKAPPPAAKAKPKPVVLEEDDEDEAPPPPKKKSRPVVEIDDDEDDRPAPKKKSKPVVTVDDEDDRPARQKKPRVVEEDEEPRPRKRGAAQDEEGDDEEARPRRRKKQKAAGMSKGLLVGLISGGVALVVVLLIFVLGGESAGGATPKQAYEQFWSYMQKKQFGRAWDSTSKASQETYNAATTRELGGGASGKEVFVKLSELAASFDDPALSTHVVVNEVINGDTATVTVEETNSKGRKVTSTHRIAKEGSRWKVELR